jgi:hypothetical protein
VSFLSSWEDRSLQTKSSDFEKHLRTLEVGRRSIRMMQQMMEGMELQHLQRVSSGEHN